MANPAKADTTPEPAGPTRTRDPWVLVSRRKYNLMYPLALLKGDMPPVAGAPKNRDGKPNPGPLGYLNVEPGPNVVAALCTVFHYEDHATTTAVVAEPPPSALRAVHLRAGHGTTFDAFHDKATKNLDVAALEAALLRALRFLADPGEWLPEFATFPRLWVTQPGFDTPDLALVQASRLFGARDGEGMRLAVLAEKDVQEQLSQLGFEVWPSKTPEEFGKYVADQLANWTDLIKRAGIRPE
mgnify:CR=1 FL=1